MSADEVLIGACGWQHPEWQNSYYPEGLPQDWRLVYYGNEYPVVLIPTAYWMQGRDEVDSWVQEMEDRPAFVCEWSFASGQQAPPLDLFAILSERVLAVLLVLNAMPDAEQLDWVQELSRHYRLCIDWPEASTQQISELVTQLTPSVSFCWHGAEDNKSRLAMGSCILARVRTEGQGPRELRTLLECLQENTHGRQAILLFDGEPPDLEIVDQAEVILNLL